MRISCRLPSGRERCQTPHPHPFALSLFSVGMNVFVCEGIMGSADWVICLCNDRQGASFSMVQIG